MKSGFYLILIYHIFTSFHVYTMIFGSRRVTLPLVLRAVFCPACVGSFPCRNLSCRPWIWASMAVSQVGSPRLFEKLFSHQRNQDEPRTIKKSRTDYPIIPCFQGLDEGRGARGTRRVFGASNVSTGAASNLCLMVAV